MSVLFKPGEAGFRVDQIEIDVPTGFTHDPTTGNAKATTSIEVIQLCLMPEQRLLVTEFAGINGYELAFKALLVNPIRMPDYVRHLAEIKGRLTYNERKGMALIHLPNQDIADSVAMTGERIYLAWRAGY